MLAFDQLVDNPSQDLISQRPQYKHSSEIERGVKRTSARHCEGDGKDISTFSEMTAYLKKNEGNLIINEKYGKDLITLWNQTTKENIFSFDIEFIQLKGESHICQISLYPGDGSSPTRPVFFLTYLWESYT